MSIVEHDTVMLEHGSGGALSRELVDELIYPAFRSDAYPELTDSTRFALAGTGCLTTDSYTVDPLFFPGGDIGRLAVFGTCNDLAVAGAKPRFLSLGLIIEEGFAITDLKRILHSVSQAAGEAQVVVVTGDTKVVPKGRGGGIYLNTSGIGELVAHAPLGPHVIRPGDAVIVSGPVGAHGIAVMAARERLSVGAQISSDCAFLFPLCSPLLELGAELRFMRDATRGGIASVLNEAVAGSDAGIDLVEEHFPIDEAVRTVAEILGLYPLEIANEGVFIAVVSESSAARAVEALHAHPLGVRASIVGNVVSSHPGTVVLETEVGGKRILDFPHGLLLPRIC